MGYIYALIGVIFIGNFYLLYSRNKKNRNKASKVATERVRTVRQHEDTKRRLQNEQTEAARRIELRNKTHEMYEMVRNQPEPDHDGPGNSADYPSSKDPGNS